MTRVGDKFRQVLKISPNPFKKTFSRFGPMQARARARALKFARNGQKVFFRKKVLKGSASLSDLPLLIELCCKGFFLFLKQKKNCRRRLLPDFEFAESNLALTSLRQSKDLVQWLQAKGIS